MNSSNRSVVVSIPSYLVARAEEACLEQHGITLQQALNTMANRVAYKLWCPYNTLAATYPDESNPNIVLSNN